jgi:competence protein ComEC
MFFLQRIKKSLVSLLVVGCLAGSSNTLSAQSLEIHQIGLSDGDASLFVIIDSTVANLPLFPKRADTTVILIDAHREYIAEPLYNYVDSILKQKLHRPILDYIVLSHVHIDHYGSMVEVMDTLLNRGDSITMVVDRINAGGINLNWPANPADTCYDDILTPNPRAAASAYQAYVRNKSTNAPIRFRWGSIPVSANLLQFKNLSNISMTCLSIGGLCYQPNGTIGPFIPTSGNGYKPKNENDLSISFLLKFQGFRYFTGGDLGGGGTYSDGETPISTYLQNTYGANFHVCAFKVSHHGSAHSTNATFISKMNPTLAIIPAALRSYRGTKLPTATVINALATANVVMRRTYVSGNPGSPLNDQWLLYYQDVVLVIGAPPGMGAPINMTVTTRIRNAFTKEFYGPPVTTTVTCNKTH